MSFGLTNASVIYQHLMNSMFAKQIGNVELDPFDIRYKPRTSIKSQALADFVAE